MFKDHWPFMMFLFIFIGSLVYACTMDNCKDADGCTPESALRTEEPSDTVDETPVESPEETDPPVATVTVTVTPPGPLCCAQNKLYVCHRGYTLCVSDYAVSGHEEHGDYVGACDL